jgi:hypothetical protein
VNSGPEPGGARCEIVLGRRLGGRSATAFREFERVDLPGGATLLRGCVADQAALHGVLARIRDLGVPLLAVRLGDEVAGAEAGRSTGDDALDDGPAGDA